MPKRLNPDDYIGKRYGKMIVLNMLDIEYGKKRKVVCQCDCGTVKSCDISDLRNGKIISCGCAHNGCYFKHNKTNARIYYTWSSMMQRCHNSNARAYKNYGGRGIRVCEEWHDAESFIKWAMANGYSDDLTIERKNVNGNYCPENCIFATRMQQARNTRVRHDNTSGTPGVYYRKENGKWRSAIGVDGKFIWLGSFDTEEAAALARKKAELKYWGKG